MVYIARLIRGIEAKNGGVDSFFVTLLAIITARNFLENILEDRHAITLQAPFYHLVSDFCHVTFSWGSIFFTIVFSTGVCRFSAGGFWCFVGDDCCATKGCTATQLLGSW